MVTHRVHRPRCLMQTNTMDAHFRPDFDLQLGSYVECCNGIPPVLPPIFLSETSPGMLVWELPGFGWRYGGIRKHPKSPPPPHDHDGHGLYESSSSSSAYFFSNRIRFMAIQCMNSPMLPGVFSLFCQERWAEVQGSVSGLLEETQALARRLDGLDERLWARTSGLGILEQFIGTTGASPKTTVFSKHESFLYIIITVLYMQDLLLSWMWVTMTPKKPSWT